MTFCDKSKSLTKNGLQKGILGEIPISDVIFHQALFLKQFKQNWWSLFVAANPRILNYNWPLFNYFP